VGDTTNWEFAAAVAAVAIGLGGLLVMTVVGVIASWRVYEDTRSAAMEAEKASLLVQEAARLRIASESQPPTARPVAMDLDGALRSLSELRAQVDALMEHQRRLQDTVRDLVESNAVRAQRQQPDLGDVQSAIKRMEDHISEIAAAVVNLSTQRP
jgi:hypothetical protein